MAVSLSAVLAWRSPGKEVWWKRTVKGMMFNSNLHFAETDLGFGEFDIDMFKVRWYTSERD